MNFYLDNGFLDIPKVAEYADKHGVAFVMIIGKRQVGKTYGVLKYMLDNDRRFIFMRRTMRELSTVTKRRTNSPFEAIDGYENKVTFSGSIDDGSLDITLADDGESSHFIGLAVSLSTIASVRGFSAKIYTDWIYDECIPESHVYKIKDEDEAFNNAHVTINGNRELKGLPPIRCWLLANSNRLDCAILKALNLTSVVEKMSQNGEEFRLLKERGIMIFMPESKEITEKRSQTALYRAIAGENNFTKMSLGNEFSHNDFSDVGREELCHYKALCVFNDDLLLLKHKSKPRLYICNSFMPQGELPEYNSADFGRNKFIKDHPNLRSYYLRGKIKFIDATVKYRFLAYMKLI